MRILLATAAVIFAVTAAQAQSAGPSADDQAVQNLVEKLKATRTVKSDAKPAEVAPTEAKSIEAAPVEAKPVEARPVEAKPAEVAPAATGTKPVEAKPVEAKPVEKPVEVKQVETKPVEAKPTQTTTKTEKKRVVTKSGETREQTARRLAEKYGIGLDLE